MAWKKGKWVYDGVPDFKNQKEMLHYFDREQKRWELGFDGLSGWYYKYLTQYMIRDRYEGYIIYPNYRKADHEIIFPWMEETIKNCQDGLWLTQRGAGKSTIMGGFMLLETAIRYPGSKSIVTADTLTNIANIFENNIKHAYYNMHDNLRPSMTGGFPEFRNKKMPTIQFQKKVTKDGKTTYEGIGSIIEGIDTEAQDAGGKVEGQGCKLMLIDELFKKTHTQNVLSKGAALVTRGQKKVGSIMSVGSCSDATAKGLETANMLWEEANARGINRLFVSAAKLNTEYPEFDNDGRKTGKYISVVDETGNINESRAEELIREVRKAFSKLSSKKLLHEYILQFPLEVDEILTANTESYWDNDVVAQYREQKKVVQIAVREQNYNKCEKPITLFTRPDGSYGYEKSDRDSAKIFLFEEPRKECTYGFGTDTIPFVTENKEGSDHVTTIKNFDTNQYVGWYQKRTHDPEIIVKDLILLQDWFNGGQNLVEKNSIGALKAIYSSKNKLAYLAKNPKRFRSKSATYVDYGLNKDVNTGALRALVVKYFTESMYEIYLSRAFDEFMSFPYKNTDLMDSMAMAEALHEDFNSLQKNKSDNIVIPPRVIYYKDELGRRRASFEGGRKSVITKDGGFDFT
jgi:hypothetical protein